MTEIKYRLVDGEPVCGTGQGGRYRCAAAGDCYVHLFPDSLCIPGLRQQRDEFKASLKEQEEEIERLKERDAERKGEIDEALCLKIKMLRTRAESAEKKLEAVREDIHRLALGLEDGYRSDEWVDDALNILRKIDAGKEK